MRKLLPIAVTLAALVLPTAPALARPHGEIVSSANTYQIAGLFDYTGTDSEYMWLGMAVGDVAAGDVNGDGTDELIFGSSKEAAPRVLVLDGKTRATIMTLTPYGSTGGARVAAGDYNGDGRADIATSPITGSGAVRIYNGVGGGLIHQFYPFGPAETGGVAVALGDISGDGRADVVTAVAKGEVPRVKAYDAVTAAVIRNFLGADQPDWDLGLDVATGDVSGDWRDDIVVAAAGGKASVFEIWDETGRTWRSSLGNRFGTNIATVDVGNLDTDSDEEIVFGNRENVYSELIVWDSGVTVRRFRPFALWVYEGTGVAVQTVQ